MKAYNIIQALITLAFQVQTSMTTAVTTSEAANAFIVGGCAGINALGQQMDHSSSCASYPPANQLACYKSECPDLAAKVTNIQPLTQQTALPFISGCRRCYKENCREPAGPPVSSCASYPPDYQLACYKSKRDANPETTTTVEVALQYPADASVGKYCAGVAPEYELECFQKLCPMPGPPGFSCGSLPPQYQIDCYKKRCYEVCIPLESEPVLQAPNPVQETPSLALQTPNNTQQSSELDGGCISVAPENQLECYRRNFSMAGPIGYSCGTLPPDLAPENREECFQKLFCAPLPVQYQLQCYRQCCSIPDISEFISGFGNSLSGILDGSSALGSSNDDGSIASGCSDDDGATGLDNKGGLFPGGHSILVV
ncbi:hypothetical protein BOTCAL_0235g00180 [Botryotinia calthae]|uniref:Uncharacterized protein n=1 Tax=Botryotinia calthae TaxID=38488 RepID=A0A4Y8CXD9_9HELO|nr:hypothetical protein BOTCAL_0235g00180 [Botryotinia calthae]